MLQAFVTSAGKVSIPLIFSLFSPSWILCRTLHRKEYHNYIWLASTLSILLSILDNTSRFFLLKHKFGKILTHNHITFSINTFSLDFLNTIKTIHPFTFRPNSSFRCHQSLPTPPLLPPQPLFTTPTPHLPFIWSLFLPCVHLFLLSHHFCPLLNLLSLTCHFTILILILFASIKTFKVNVSKWMWQIINFGHTF